MNRNPTRQLRHQRPVEQPMIRRDRDVHMNGSSELVQEVLEGEKKIAETDPRMELHIDRIQRTRVETKKSVRSGL
jgi:hypothetical protein